MLNWNWSRSRNGNGPATVRLPRTRREHRRQHKLQGMEVMEPRTLLSVNPIHIGAVYLEQDAGSDVHGDRFELTFTGGAPGTVLDQVVFDGDQVIEGFSVGDVFFDTRDTGRGADHSFDFFVVDSVGIDRVQANVDDGGTRLVLDFEGFHAGESLVFHIDVDEVEAFDEQESNLEIVNDGFDPITSGVEFQGTLLAATFSAPDFYEISGTAEFLNRYDEALSESGLDLPADDADGQRDRTAGGFLPALQQEVIPAQLSGHVFHDRNDNGTRDEGEEGIAQSTIRLIPVKTVVAQAEVTTTTDGDGQYAFRDIAPGTYRILQVQQPADYLDGQESLGQVDLGVAGTAVDDAFEDIRLLGGARGIDYDFGELLPVSIRGSVHLTDEFGNCVDNADSAEAVAGVEIQLLDALGQVLDRTFTDDRGDYVFEGLPPGTYRVREITPEGLVKRPRPCRASPGRGGSPAGRAN